MSLTIRDPGLLTLLVDGGRPRSRSLGVPLGGAADLAALALGNALVGNSPDTLAIEFAFAGPTLKIDGPTACVVFGAPFAVTIDGRPAAAGTTFSAATGSVVRIAGTTSGARGYFCVAGGFTAPAILGSSSSLDPLRAGDHLSCWASSCQPHSLPFASFPPPNGANPDPIQTIRAMEGPQYAWFEDDSFFHQSFTVTPASNRMGSRLSGTPLRRRPGELVSEAVAPGAVQVANDGQPIVLGVDGQTIGGYPKVAHVIRADLDLLGQLRPGAKVRFHRVDLAEADLASRARSTELGNWLARLRAAERTPHIETDV